MPAALQSKIENQKSRIAALPPLLLDWFTANARDLPWRRTSDPYAIWVSEIMLQQTQVKTVVPYWERWMRELPTIAALAKAPSEKIHKLWEGLGYYTRVRNLQKAAQVIVQKHRGRFPDNLDALLDLPGIGRYTAGAICSIAFNQPTPILDGNVIRVLTRVFGIEGDPRAKETNSQLWQISEALVLQSKIKNQKSKISCSHLNQSLMELGALICTPRDPQCADCPVARHCVALRDGKTDRLPCVGIRPAATARRFVAFVFERNGRFLVRQRPSGSVNAHLWEFPNVELAGTDADLSRAARTDLGVAAEDFRPLCTIRHSITRYQITLNAYHARLVPAADGGLDAGKWFSLSKLDSLALPSAHRKLLIRLKASMTPKSGAAMSPRLTKERCAFSIGGSHMKRSKPSGENLNAS